ncbi:hypothetical protein QC762_108120 [Podospora pseudocomata]|uniref:Fibroin-3 related protein n=1 Tax=Podospora pseudocomata TaxID=2093779 RepID=A0ABR0GTX6_9PEZI|nr:hypothetical protein QC762_108120 [Podospora pseudocomata]
MPAVDAAMRRSVGEGFLDLLARAIHPALVRRNLEGQIGDVRATFASWDSCMAESYCKWLVIGLMILGGIIIFSVLWCIIRCACCAKSCCCSCFKCLQCCGNCCGCCDPPRGDRRQYLDEPYIPPNQGYKSQEPMHLGYDSRPTAPPVFSGGGVGGGYAASTGVTSKPQYAEFDVSKNKPGNEDALPEMPSWEGAESKKIVLEEEEEAVEMNQLKKPEANSTNAQSPTMMNGVAAAGVIPGRGSTSPNPGNRSPYGPPGAGAQSNGYFPPGAVANDPYNQTAQSYNQPAGGYGQPGQGYGMAPGANGPGAVGIGAIGPGAMGPGAIGPGRRSPGNVGGGYNTGYDNNDHGQPGYGQQGYGQQQQGVTPRQTGQGGGYDNYGDIYDSYGTGTNQPYGGAQELDAGSYGQPPSAQPAAGPQAGYGGAYGQGQRRTPGPQADAGYGNPNQRRTPGPQSDYNNGYGGSPRRTPAPQDSYGGGGYDAPAPAYGSSLDRRSPGPQQGYGRPPPNRQYSSSDSRGPQRQYSGNDVSSSSDNMGGFDFGTGYSRPPQQQQQPNSGYGRPPQAQQSSGYRQPTTPVVEEQSAAYPGYKPYSPGPPN